MPPSRRLPEPSPRDIAQDLFREHLDLDRMSRAVQAMRAARGQMPSRPQPDTATRARDPKG